MTSRADPGPARARHGLTADGCDTAWRQGGGKAGGHGGSILGGIVAAVDALLQARYKPTWHCTLPVAQSLFNRLRSDALPLLQGALKQLVVMILRVKHLPPKAHDALDAALGAAIVAIGPARLLEAVPLFADPAAPSLAAPNNTWLLPALKRHVRAAQLDYFTQTLLPLADRLRDAAVAAEAAGRPVEAKNLMVLHEQVGGAMVGGLHALLVGGLHAW